MFTQNRSGFFRRKGFKFTGGKQRNFRRKRFFRRKFPFRYVRSGLGGKGTMHPMVQKSIHPEYKYYNLTTAQTNFGTGSGDSEDAYQLNVMDGLVNGQTVNQFLGSRINVKRIMCKFMIEMDVAQTSTLVRVVLVQVLSLSLNFTQPSITDIFEFSVTGSDDDTAPLAFYIPDVSRGYRVVKDTGPIVLDTYHPTYSRVFNVPMNVVTQWTTNDSGVFNIISNEFILFAFSNVAAENPPFLSHFTRVRYLDC